MSEERDEDLAPIGEEQLRALEELLRTAAQRGIPALVFGHYGLNATIAVDGPLAFRGSQSEEIQSIFRKCGGRVVYFSGHIHRGLTAEPGVSTAQVDGVTMSAFPRCVCPTMRITGPVSGSVEPVGWRRYGADALHCADTISIWEKE